VAGGTPKQMTAVIKFIALVGLFCCTVPVLSQSNPSLKRQWIAAQKATIERSSFMGRQPGSLPSQAVQIPESLLARPRALKQHLNKHFNAAKAPLSNRAVEQHTSNTCLDTSFRRLISINDRMLYVQAVTQLKDGSMLIPMVGTDTTTNPNSGWRSYGLLLKLDGDGNTVWLKQFEDLTPGDQSYFGLTRAIELSNGDIICAGYLYDDVNSSVYKTIVYRLTSTGSIIWQNCLQTGISLAPRPPGIFSFKIESAVEGLNGDVILCGTSSAIGFSMSLQTVVRLNNLGKWVWDANYGNHGEDGSYRFGAEGVHVTMQNGQVVLVGLSRGSGYTETVSALNFLTLDYATGNLLKKRFFRPDYADINEEFQKSFTYTTDNFTRLANGHWLFYCQLFSDNLQVGPVIHHFGVIEFDAAFNLVNSYTVSSGLVSNSGYNVMYFDASGKGLIYLMDPIDIYEGNMVIGAFQNGQFQKQRVATYVDAGVPGIKDFAFLKDNGYAFIQTYFEIGLTSRNNLEFRKMHNSDTSSQCLGRDTMLFRILPFQIIEDPDYYYLDPNKPNQISELEQSTSQTDTLKTNSRNPCKKTATCDTVKIHGDTVICGNAASLLFTAFKNIGCGGIVQWHIDKSAIDSLVVLTDSSVRIWFKNSNWQGKLYATLPAGACAIPAIDSVAVRVTRVQTKINLGRDTILCNQNSLVLHAGNNFSSYLWQDGSRDSVLKITKPGIYSVHVSDLCGNRFADTITVNPFNVAISIGANRVKCNTDTLHLSAPPGFTSYTWGNNYNISSLKSQTVVVNPLVDTSYYIKAEKAPGCFAYDTVHITVLHSPVIDLGLDQSFCSGDSVTFDARAGFSSYTWSTGDTLSKITVRALGSYRIKATTAQGCSSYDTVFVRDVWGLPDARLDKRTGLCAGEVRTLNPGNFQSYIWQDGSTAPTFTVSAPGHYFVQVKDVHGCAGHDSTNIKDVLSLPTNFLPLDTTLCSYSTLVIKPVSDYKSYLWNEGSRTERVTIKQPGMYWLQVEDNNGCIGKDSITVHPKECMSGVYVPTAFSPNKDRKNDLFSAQVFGPVARFELIVYNRWGRVIFKTTDPTKGWDGRFSGIEQDSGTFIWMCRYRLEGEPEKMEKGTVVLIR
jgi:gliding motility-associated-like protein